MRRILIINPFGIGDVLFTTPVVGLLRKKFSDSFIGYICNKRVEEVLVTNPDLDEVFVFEKGEYRNLWKESKLMCIKKFVSFLKEIRRRKFDLAIDFSLGHQYSLFLKMIGVPRRVGFNYKNRGRFLTDKVDIDGFSEKHVAEYYMDLVSFLGIEPEKDGKFQMFPSDDDRRWVERFLADNGIKKDDLIIGIVPVGGTSWGEDAFYKHWPEDKFAEVSDELSKRYNARVIILGDSSEQDKCKNVMSLMENKPLMACGRTTLRQFAALLSKCKLIICNDGGPLHVAVSQGTKTVSIFGPVDEKVYGPYPPSEDHIVITKAISCRPCYKRFRVPRCESLDCLTKINPDEVLHAVEKNLQMIS